ncbi:MAG: hypothetical protein ACOYMN_14015, partial [Roseimicrobium sp.]
MPQKNLLRVAPWFLAAFIIIAHVVLSIFWRAHDEYDDTGYMLAILRGVHGGGILYREIFTQYGPFHTQAWLTLLNCTGWPIDHNHAGLVVCLLWTASAGILGWWGFAITRNAWWAAALACWGAWSLGAFAAELAHPISLAVLLLVLVLVGSISGDRKWCLLRSALGGAALAALIFTKINLGVFTGVAVSLALLTVWNRGGWLSHIAMLGALGMPWMLLGETWALHVRVLLGIAVCLATLMAVRTASTPKLDAVAWKPEFSAWAAGFSVAMLLIVATAMAQGVSLADLRGGMLQRPLQLSSISYLAPLVSSWDYLAVTTSGLLAVGWHIPRVRLCKSFWAAATVGTAVLVLGKEALAGRDWTVGAASLLWLAIVAAEECSTVHRRGVLLAVLLAAWQGLGIFPVCGAQSAIPR